ncbi:MAG: hypothetical protein ABH865_01720 [Candidatus Omnitrophota bacterium]|nr:hypothetical protein [Candidatus Omnitrophota bacterium]
MATKYSLNIIKSRVPWWEYLIFDITFEESVMGVINITFDLRTFYREGYLAELIKNAKGEGDMCFMVSSFPITTLDGIPEEKLERARQYIPASSTLHYEKPAKKLFGFHKGSAITFWPFIDAKLRTIPDILDRIDSENTRCFFIFDKEGNAADVRGRIEDLVRNNTLDTRHVAGLQLEFIEYGFGAKELIETFKLFISRFNKEEMRTLFANSMFADAEKFKMSVR